MPVDVPLRCDCGKLHGTLRAFVPSSGTRIVCYCDDCQAFARFLERTDTLDARGGTDIFQMAPADVTLASDDDALACVRLSPKGLFRWYCAHCKTPVGNTASGKWPFIGLTASMMDLASTGQTRDELLGKPRGYVQTKFAIGGPPPEATALRTVTSIARAFRKFAGFWIRGKGRPSPFFDADKRAVVTPRVLTREERRAVTPS